MSRKSRNVLDGLVSVPHPSGRQRFVGAISDSLPAFMSPPKVCCTTVFHGADSKTCFDEIPEDNPEDELESWADYIKRATRKADDLLAANRITSWILRQSQLCWRQARMTAKHHEDRGTKIVSNWNPAISTKQDQPRDGRISTTTYPQRKTPRNGVLWKVTSYAADSTSKTEPVLQRHPLK